VLADGGSVWLRALSLDDRAALEAFYARLSRDSRYLRFFHGSRRPPPGFVERETRAPSPDHMALGAFLGRELVGVASAERIAGTQAASVAFAVADAHQGRGLGTALLEHLAEAASERGIREFQAETLVENSRMLEVLANAGFELERRKGSCGTDGSLVSLRFPIAPTPALRAAVERREQQAEARSIARLLAPRSIAVVGAARERGKIGHEILRNLEAGGFRGALYPVHPSAAEIAGRRAYPSILAIPGDVDLVVVAVPAPAVPEVVAQCARRDVRGLVVISSGFGESGAAGGEAERELAAFARRWGMRVVGPNCIGIANSDPGVRMNATFVPGELLRGSLGLASQSGAIGIAALAEARALGLGISSFVSLGNRADVSANDLLQYWENDAATRVIALYLESFGNPQKFARIAPRVARRKPILALKSGRTRAGLRAALSHTAALATPDAAVDALFAQAGVIRVETAQELFDCARLLACQPLPAGRRVAIVGNSGGPGIMAADACEREGLEVAPFPEALQQRLAGLAPGAAGLSNPVDLGAAVTPAALEGALRAVLDSPDVDAALAICTPTLVTRAEDMAAAIRRAAEKARDKPLLACLLAVPEIPAALRPEPGVELPPVYAYPENAVRALALAARYTAWCRRPDDAPPELPGFDAAAARRLVHAALAEGRGWLDPVDAFALLAAAGIPAAAVERVGSAEQARERAAALGVPLALKAASPDIVHKTEAGALRLSLVGADAVEKAFRELHAALGERMGGALLQPMCAPGTELIAGISHDPALGALVMLGLGGTLAELLGDRALHVVPLGPRAALELRESLRCAPLFHGYRGAPPLDGAAVDDVVLRLARLADEVPEIAELDLNPLVVRAEGAVVVDARVRVAPAVPLPDRVSGWLGGVSRHPASRA
jgi:acetyl coenzyme A synthetase (ADP forming)-like protein